MTLTDQLPSGVTLQSATPSQGSLESAPAGTVVAALGMIRSGGSATLTIVITTSASSPSSITDTASVTSQPADPLNPNPHATVTTTVLSSADLSVALSSSSDSVLAGSDLTYTMVVENSGPDGADAVSATLPLPDGVTFVSANTTVGTVSNSSGTITAAIGAMAPGAQTTIQVVVQPDDAGELTLTASVSSDAIQDPDPSNNSSTTAVDVEPASDLGVTISTSPEFVESNGVFEYVVTVTDAGPSDASNVLVEDTLPPGVEYEGASTSLGVTPTVLDGVVSATFSTLKAGTQATLTIKVAATVAPGSTLTDLAAVPDQPNDPNQANNTATLVTAVVGRSDLGVTASAPGAVYVGQGITYTLEVSNSGPDAEPSPVVTCPFPSDLSLISTSSTPGQPAPVVSGGIFTAHLGPLLANSTLLFSLSVSPQAAAAGSLVTDFSIQGVNVDSNQSNNTAETSVTVTPAADLAVAITPAVFPPARQANWTYTVFVADLGPSPSTGVKVLVPLPANTQFVSATASQGSDPTTSDGVIEADLGDLAAGKSAAVTVEVEPTSLGALQLAASVSGTEFDPNGANNQTSLAVTVAPSANLTVSLVPQFPTVMTGQHWTLTATVANSGPDPATDTILRLPLASDLVFNSPGPGPTSSNFQAGQIVAQLGTLAPGASTTVSFVVTAAAAGIVNQSAIATESDNQLDPGSNTATTTVTVLESAGLLQFGASGYAVPETAGAAQVQVVRFDGRWDRSRSTSRRSH